MTTPTTPHQHSHHQTTGDIYQRGGDVLIDPEALCVYIMLVMARRIAPLLIQFFRSLKVSCGQNYDSDYDVINNQLF